MFILLQVLQGILGIISLVCFILVLVRMFQENQTGLGVACIILLFCFGIGALIAFIVGWVNAGRWGINNIMTI
jgi:ABC-type transport system involved in cytochrome bd biosynthesis fused ATPase/permease subunit